MLLPFLTTHQDRIVEALYQAICQTMSADTPFAPHVLRANVGKAAEAFLAALREDDSTPLERYLVDLVAPHTVMQFPLAVLHQAFAVFSELLLPLLHECYGDDMASLLAASQRLQRLLNTTLTALVTRYENLSKALVQQQHEQLQAYNRGLEAQLIQVGEKFQTLQELNESILQSMTSGLLVADKTTHRILRINHAMERLSALPAADMVGKTAEDAFAGWQGIPFEALAEEVEHHGQITRRKYHLVNAQGHTSYRAISGQVFYDRHGDSQGVIVIVDDISESEILRETFSRYLSQQVMEQVLSSADLRALQSTRREVTVLFADIRRFTAFAERYPPESVVDVLNQYLEVMVQAVFNQQGTLDKFLGDGLLAVFGTPLQQPDHPQRAVQTALEIQQAIAALNATRHAVNAPALTIGIGINSGEAIVGNIGSEKRMEYTVVGDMVNVAQRLQGQARGGEIIISAPVLAHVHSLVTVYDSLEAQVRGRRQPVLAHRIGPPGS